MTLLIIGLLLWSVAHLFKRLAPNLRARLGNTAKGGVAVALFVSIVLMVLGYRSADTATLWALPAWTTHVNNTLMLLAVALLGLGNSKSRLRGTLRHPMLLGVLTWAVAHLLVNGDLASLVLFGGLGLWSLFQMTAINARQPNWDRWTGGSFVGDIRLGVITVVVYGVIIAIHSWIGLSPIPGM